MKKILIFNFIIFFVMLFSCQKGEDIVDENENGKYKSGADFYLSFDEENSKKVLEEKNKKEYEINYVFHEAKYKNSEYIKRSQGVRGKAILFDGYSTDIPMEDYAFPSEDFTISVWIAPRAFETRTDKLLTGIISCLDSSAGYELGCYNYGQWAFKIFTTMGYKEFWIKDSPLQLYEWNHLVVSFQAKEKVSFYHNGKLVYEEKMYQALPLPTASLVIGRSKICGSKGKFLTNYYSGLMDEVEIYHKALSSELISNKYQQASKDMKKLDIYEDLWLSDEVLADDRYFPQYHLRVGQNWQNETYGMFYYQGKYHAFCQQNVFGPYYTDGQRWGHFVSDDLVSWELLTPILLPENNSIDKNSIFSGSAILDGYGNPVVFYTGVDFDGKYMNMISSARPKDLSDPNLEQWEKSNIVLINQGDLSIKENFRDPYIYQENGEYYMLICGTNSHTQNGELYCYKALNKSLDQWEYLGVSYSGNKNKYSFLGNCYELPNLIKLYNKEKTISKYMLMFSPIQGTRNGVYYLLGDFNLKTGKFIPEQEEPILFDCAPESQVLCPSSFYDVKFERNLLITMSRTGMDSTFAYDSGWAECMTLIKEIYLSEEGTLSVNPIREYDRLIREVMYEQRIAKGISEVNQAIHCISADMLKIEIEIKANQATKVGLYVKKDHSGVEQTFIYYDLNSSKFGIDNSKSSIDMNNNGSGSGIVNVEGNICLTVFVDRSMVEAYIKDQQQITVFGFHASKNASGIEVYANHSSAQIVKMKVSKMGSSHPYDKEAYWG